MAQATPTRRALVDLPVNTFGTPSALSNPGKGTPSHKRTVDAVSEPEYPRLKSPVKVLHTDPQKGRKDEMEIESVVPSEVAPLLKPTIPATVVDPGEPAEDVGDGDSQNSYISNMDFDADDTMVSQQTAATEVSQPVQSRARQYAENLRLRLRLAHFKVRTNQTHTPLSQLRVSTTNNQESPRTQEPSLPQLLPAPILRPAVSSTRTIAEPHLPSSPPISPENESLRDEVFRTPALPRHSMAMRQTNSPPDSQERASRQAYKEEDSLTSSVVRGNAAIGLLGLRQER